MLYIAERRNLKVYEVKRVRLRLRDGARSVEIRSESNVISVERVDQNMLK